MNIKEIIDKLQNIDAADLKNIDWSGIKHTLLSRTDLMIITTLVAVTFVSTVYIFAGNKAKASSLSAEIRKLEAKLEVAEKNKTLKAEYDEFLEVFPEEKTVDEMVDKLSGYALEEAIKIVSYTPAKEINKDYAAVNSFTISVVGENYQRILSFLKMIENTSYALRLESWKAIYFSEETAVVRSRQSSRRTRAAASEVRPSKKEGVRAEIKLSLIKLKR